MEHDRCCCGRIEPFTDVIIINDIKHERLGIDGNFCGPIYKHELRDLRERVEDLEFNASEHERLKGRLNEVLHPEGDGPKKPAFIDLIAFVENDIADLRSELTEKEEEIKHLISRRKFWHTVALLADAKKEHEDEVARRMKESGTWYEPTPTAKEKERG